MRCRYRKFLDIPVIVALVALPMGALAQDNQDAGPDAIQSDLTVSEEKLDSFVLAWAEMSQVREKYTGTGAR